MRRLRLLILVAAAGCSSGPAPSSLRVSARQAALLFAPEPGATPADYRARSTRFRLFGVQPNAAAGPFATVAEEGSWRTRNLSVGDLLGRNIELVEIDGDGIELREPGHVMRLATGGALTVQVIEHRFDSAVAYRGRGLYKVDAAAAAELVAAHGLGGALSPCLGLFGRALCVARMEPRGLLLQLGLEVGDRVLTVNGGAASLGAIDRLVDRFDGGKPVTLRISRNGEVWQAQYQP